MTIMGLDISSYQENIPYGQVIDWKKLKADPLNFRFIWIKSGEGVDSTSYHEDASRQVAGAKSVNFEAVNLYHYYLYQYMNTVGNWVVIPYVDQANAFYQAYLNIGLDIKHPMTDLEDPLIDRFLGWSDTATINAAIAFARRLNKHLKDFHYYLETLFKVKPDIYTGKWWLDKFVPLLISNGYVGEVLWMKEFNFILADYDGTLNIPDYIGPTIAWQKDSTPVPPVQGIPTGHIVAGDALDIDQWMLSDQVFEEWSEGEVMTAIYNTKVPQINRAKILTLESNQKLAVTTDELHIDAVILPMATMSNWINNSHWQTKTETTFIGRYDLFHSGNIPVFGRFELDAGSMIAEQHGDAEFKNREPEDNFVIPFLINAWHVGDWNWDRLHNKQGVFRNISALVISEVKQTPFKNVPPNGYWQKLIFDYVVYHLRTLMMRGQIPTVPIIMYSGGWWLRVYPEMDTELDNDKSWLYLSLGKWEFFSTSIFNTLDEIFAFRPAEDFTFKLPADTINKLPEWNVRGGYEERVLLHEYTGEAQRCKQITDATGTPMAVNLSLWNDTKENMYSFLKFTTTEPPSISPSLPDQVDFTDLDNSLLVIEEELEKIRVWRKEL